MENPIKMDDLEVPLFSETSIWFESNPKETMGMALMLYLKHEHVYSRAAERLKPQPKNEWSENPPVALKSVK